MIHPDRYADLGELLCDALVQYKSHTALIEASRKKVKRELTYLQFKQQAMVIADRLQKGGVTSGTRVAIVMSNQPAWLISAYAAFYCGAVLVPIDYKLTAEEQGALLTHSSAEVLITEYPSWLGLAWVDFPAALRLVADVPAGETLDNAEQWPSIATAAGAPVVNPPRVRRERSDVATIVYSSGTGGRPKGCMLSHDAYLQQYQSLLTLFPMDERTRYFSILPTNHAIDFMCGFIGPMACGATIVHQRTLRPEFILDTMKRLKITHMALVPMILEAFERKLRERLDAVPSVYRKMMDGLAAVNLELTRKQPNRQLSKRLLGSVHGAFGGHLKYLFCGGAFVDRSRAEFFYKLGIPVVIGYGLTETCTVATVNDLHPFRGDTVGSPVPGVDVRVQATTPASNDAAQFDGREVGEVQIRGRTVMLGYLDEPELTAESFDGEWFRTGDRGWIDAAGHLHLVGRSHNMIITEGGKNIYPEDIEGAFVEVPVDELAVFAADYIWPREGLTNEQLIAVARSRDSNVTQLLTKLRERNRALPDFKRVSGVLWWDDDFPRTASMKVKRHELAQAVRDQETRDAIVPL